MLCISFYVLMVLCFGAVKCETANITDLVKEFEASKIKSKNLEKYDRELSNSWMESFQVRLVDVLTKYRVQKTRHKEHSFDNHLNDKWTECIKAYKKRITDNDRNYNKNETRCLKEANTAGKEHIKSVEQLENEIRKWRRAYKYLVHKCHVNYPDSEDNAAFCLVENMTRNNFDVTIERLLMLKQDAMSRLALALNKAGMTFDDCLRRQLSLYLDGVRSLMILLGFCYNSDYR